MSYNFLIALVNLSPGNFIFCPTFKPVYTITVCSSNLCSPFTDIPPSSYLCSFINLVGKFLIGARESLTIESFFT